MHGIFALVEQYAIDRILSGGAPVSHKSKAGFALLALAGFLLLLGLVFLTYALNLWLYQIYTPQVATAITGGLCIFSSILILMIAYLILQYKKVQAQKMQRDTLETVHSLIEYVDEELRESVEKNPLAALAIALAAGFVGGKSYL